MTAERLEEIRRAAGDFCDGYEGELLAEVDRLRALADKWREEAIMHRARAIAPDVCGLLERETENERAQVYDRCAAEVLDGR